jgi:hypothetical protein
VQRPIRLDDQSRAETDEIDDVGSNRNLTAELEAVEASVAEQSPEYTLVERRPAPHAARAIVRSVPAEAAI